MPPRLPPIAAEALKTIALVLHAEGRGRAPRRQSRAIVAHALLLVRQSEGPLDADQARRWLEGEAGLAAQKAWEVGQLARRVARGEGFDRLGRSPLRANILQIWLDRAQGLAESPFDRVLEALRTEPTAAA